MARLLLLRCLTLVILPNFVWGDVPPPRCRTTDSTDRPYECLLCGAADDAALREGVTYLINGDCSFNALESPVVLPNPITVTDSVHIQPLDINSATPLVGQLVVTGTDVRIRDVFVSDTIVVRGKEVTGLQLTNITTTESTTVLEVEPTSVHHDIDITGLTALQLQTTATVEAISADLQPVATFFHSFGDMTLVCADQQTVIVQPMIPSGIATLAGCDVINFTAILDAYGNAFTYDVYGTAEPEWVETVRSWAITLTAVSAGLILLTRKPKAPKTDAPPTTPTNPPPATKWI